MFTGIQFSGYKLFCDENIIKLKKITNINVIIGKNNSGKSSLLDVIEMVYDETSFKKQSRQISSIRVRVPMTRDMVQTIFPEGHNIGVWNEKNYWEKVEGKSVLLELGGTKKSEYPRGYRVIDAGAFLWQIKAVFFLFSIILNDKREIIYLDVYPQKEILCLKKKWIWTFPVREREPVIWLEYS